MRCSSRRIFLGSGGRRGRGRGLFGGGGRLGVIRSRIGRIPIANEVPFTVDDTGGLRGEEPEETTGKVEATVGASGTLVHNGGNGALSIVRHTDLLEAVGTGVSTAVLLNGRGQATAVALGRGKYVRHYSERQ